MTEAERETQDDETIAAGIRNEKANKMVGDRGSGPDADEFEGTDADGNLVGSGDQETSAG